MPSSLPCGGLQVLICAPYGRDGASTAELLKNLGYASVVCGDLTELAGRLTDSVSAALVTEEALTSGVEALAQAIKAQPSWSDVPVIYLAAHNRSGRAFNSPNTEKIIALTANVIILERPLSTQSLTSAVFVATRGRDRQFQIRDQIMALAANAEALKRAGELLESKVEARTAELKQEMANRAKVEDALRQSQKMEAVGQLTGGIAHDFNNMLQGIGGAISLIRRRIAAGRINEIERFLDAAATSTARAAALTQRLLAYSRRQSLDAKPTDLNMLLLSLKELLQQSLTEQVAVQFVLASDSPTAIVDSNQLETAILNLAINARDAMPNGGQLTLTTRKLDLPADGGDETATLAPGPYVSIAISDNGVGMDGEIIERAFDPFFTTKPLGQGTGLGLSMVYGFAQQSGGQVKIKSRPGEGTTVTIYLPASARAAPEEIEDALAIAHQGDGRTVLVVDDEDNVRMVVQEILGDLGYRAIPASSSERAIDILASTQEIDLLISDVGLPGMNGRELAEVARKHRPALPIIFITGYAENAAIRAGFLGTNMTMVTKPFKFEDLTAKIAEMLPRTGA